MEELRKRMSELELKFGKFEQFWNAELSQEWKIRQIWINKEQQIEEAKEIPIACPECKYKDGNFMLFKLDKKLITISLIKCPKCKWTKDITNYVNLN